MKKHFRKAKAGSSGYEISNWRAAWISELDEGFLFGMGAFETIAVEKGKPILLEKHLERLEQAADYFKLGSCSERGLSRERVLSYLAGQGSKFTDHGVLKIVCSVENLFFQMRTNTYSEEDYAKGFVADIIKVRRNETSPLVYHKTLNYGDCILEKSAAAAIINEKVFVSHKKPDQRGTATAIFSSLRKNMIYTPQLSCDYCRNSARIRNVKIQRGRDNHLSG